MRVLLTRAPERCGTTAAKLALAGHESIILPLSSYRDTDVQVPAGSFDAAVFTSAAAVESLSRRIGRDGGQDGALAPLWHVAAFCVGDATAMSARENGFTNVRNAGGDAAALAGLIASAGPAMAGRRLLYPAQPNRAFDLASALPDWEVCEFNAYEARQFDPGKAAFTAAVERCDAVFLYSPRSASHFVGLLVRHVTSDALPRLTLIAISEKTAQATMTGPAAGTGQIIDAGHDFPAKNARFHIKIAARPDEDAMIALLGAGDATYNGSFPVSINDEEDKMNQKRGAPRRPVPPKTIDLSATEVLRAQAEERAAAEASGIAATEQAAENAAAQSVPAADAPVLEDEQILAQTRDETGHEAASEPVSESASDPVTRPDTVFAEADEMRDADAAARQSVEADRAAEAPVRGVAAEPAGNRRGAGPLGLLTAAVLGGVVAIGGIGALNASGAIGSIPGLKGLFAASPSQTPGETGADLTALQERIAALESAQAASAGSAASASSVDPARVEALESRIAAVETQASQLAQTLAAPATAPDGAGIAAPDPQLTARVEQLEASVSQLSSTVEANGGGANGGVDSAVISQLSGKVDAGLESVNAAVSQATGTIAAVENRVATLEQTVSQMAQTAQEEAQSGKGAAQMIAANALRSAADEGRPFGDLIQSVEALTGPGPALDTLKAQAATGLATPASLAASFEPAADAILALDAPKPEGIVSGLLANARSLIKVQPQGPVAGDTPEAIVSQIRAALAAGDLTSAYALWEKLPEQARNASAQWAEKLKARLDAGTALEGVMQALTPGQG